MTKEITFSFSPPTGKVEATCPEDLIKSKIFMNPDIVRDTWGEEAANQYIQSFTQKQEPAEMQEGPSYPVGE